MISASEALTLTRNSEKFTQDLLEKLDPLIRKEAEAGKRHVDVSIDFVGQSVNSLSHPYWAPVVQALKNNGFRVTEGKDRVRHGLGGLDDEESLPFYYYVIVSW